MKNRHPIPVARPNLTGSHDHGFTLIELVIVIMLLGILAVAGTPGDTTGLKVTVLARQLMMDIRLAQAYAMNRGTGYRILATDSSTYEIRQPGGATMPGTTTSLPDATVDSFNISFDALGQPSSGATITITLGSQTSTVTVTAVTGKITQP